MHQTILKGFKPFELVISFLKINPKDIIMQMCRDLATIMLTILLKHNRTLYKLKFPTEGYY